MSWRLWPGRLKCSPVAWVLFFVLMYEICSDTLSLMLLSLSPMYLRLKFSFFTNNHVNNVFWLAVYLCVKFPSCLILCNDFLFFNEGAYRASVAFFHAIRFLWFFLGILDLITISPIFLFVLKANNGGLGKTSFRYGSRVIRDLQCLFWRSKIDGSRGSQEATNTGLYVVDGLTTHLSVFSLVILPALLKADIIISFI